MRIAQACFRFGAPGGAEDHVLQISKELQRRGHEVTVHASDILTETPWKRGGWKQPDGEERIDGIRVVRHRAFRRPFSDRYLALTMPGMLGGLLREDCDLIHAHSHRYYQLEAAASAAAVRRLPLYITPHYHPAEEKEPVGTRAMLKVYDLYSSGSLYSFWVTPDAKGASGGYIAAGGPGFDGVRDVPRP